MAQRLAESDGKFKNVKVVANLPYYITTPIIFSFLEDKMPALKSMTFMVQKEVAKRMTAKPGGKDYGALTVTVGYFSVAEINFIVPPHCFRQTVFRRKRISLRSFYREATRAALSLNTSPFPALEEALTTRA